jgi:hypothetical protein
VTSPLRILGSLDEIAELLESWRGDGQLFVRWTDDVQRDVQSKMSRDELTGVELPGLSANSLQVESWWGDRPLRTWVARRLYDYRHLPEIRSRDTRPWIIAGRECGRGPDNEPLIEHCTPVAEVLLRVIDVATEEVHRIADDWGTMRRA